MLYMTIMAVASRVTCGSNPVGSAFMATMTESFSPLGAAGAASPPGLVPARSPPQAVNRERTSMTTRAKLRSLFIGLSLLHNFVLS